MKTSFLKLISTALFLVIWQFAFSQQGGPTCGGAAPFCSDDPTYSFPAGVNSGSFGSSIGCLGSTPNPAWYYLQVDQPGRINIHMWTSPSRDLDFACWGPFTASSFAALQASGVCSQLLLNCSSCSSHGPSSGANPSNLGGYPVGNMTDCSYASDPIEYVHIPNAQTGQWYILLITNYSNQACQINFQSHTTSVGSTNCAIVRPFHGDTVCVGETAVLTVENPIAGANYTFEGPAGFYQYGPTPSVTITNTQPNQAGTYTMVLHPPTGQTGAAVSATLVVSPKPNVTITANDVCPNQNSTLTGAGAATYNWSSGNTGNPITVTPTITTTYTVTGTSAQGCTNTASVTVSVYENPVVTINPSMICSGQQAIVSSPTGATYHWCCSLGDTAIINPVVTQTEVYTITVTDLHGCFTIDTVVVNPDAIIEAIGDAICTGEVAQISATGGTYYTWNNGMQTATISINPTFTTSYSVTGTNQYGCSGINTTTVEVYPKPVADFTVQSDIVTLDNPDLAFQDASTNATSWYWNFGEFLSPSNTSIVQNPIHTYSAVGKYTTWLIVTSDYGCIDSTSIVIQVESPYSFYIPNAFSPDKDGLNEVFKPVGRGLDPSNFTMMIFDRWGQIIFISHNSSAYWDGYLDSGIKAPHGIYVYRFFLIDLEGIPHEYTGNFTIIR